MSIPLSVKQFSRAGRLTEVPLASTVFSQDQLDYNKVDRMAKKKKRDELPPAFAAMVGDKTIVQDGHHRTAADIKKRRKTTTMRIF